MKSKMYLFQIIFCICLILSVTACAKRTDVNEKDNYIYCLNQEGNGLVKVEFDFPDTDTQGIADAILAELAAPVEDIEYMQAIPEKVTVNSCTVNGVLAYVDFSKEYFSLSTVDEKLMQAAVVESLLQVKDINGVWFTVDGEDIKGDNGVVLGIMNSDDFVQTSELSLSAYQTTSLALYFANESGDKLVKQEMDVKYNNNVPIEKVIVDRLMKGPKKTGAYPTINPQATLLSVTIQESVCYVNFDSEFLNRTYDVHPEITVYSIVNSLIEGTSASKVQITVNGEKDVIYEDTVNLSNQFEKNEELIEE